MPTAYHATEGPNSANATGRRKTQSRERGRKRQRGSGGLRPRDPPPPPSGSGQETGRAPQATAAGRPRPSRRCVTRHLWMARGAARRVLRGRHVGRWRGRLTRYTCSHVPLPTCSPSSTHAPGTCTTDGRRDGRTWRNTLYYVARTAAGRGWGGVGPPSSSLVASSRPPSPRLASPAVASPGRLATLPYPSRRASASCSSMLRCMSGGCQSVRCCVGGCGARRRRRLPPSLRQVMRDCRLRANAARRRRAIVRPFRRVGCASLRGRAARLVARAPTPSRGPVTLHRPACLGQASPACTLPAALARAGSVARPRGQLVRQYVVATARAAHLRPLWSPPLTGPAACLLDWRPISRGDAPRSCPAPRRVADLRLCRCGRIKNALGRAYQWVDWARLGRVPFQPLVCTSKCATRYWGCQAIFPARPR